MRIDSDRTCSVQSLEPTVNWACYNYTLDMRSCILFGFIGCVALLIYYVLCKGLPRTTHSLPRLTGNYFPSYGGYFALALTYIFNVLRICGSRPGTFGKAFLSCCCWDEEIWSIWIYARISTVYATYCCGVLDVNFYSDILAPPHCSRSA